MSRETHDNWLMTAEHMGLGVPGDPADLDTPAWRGYDVLTHTPPDKRWTDELHRRSIRSMPYLTLCYQYIGNDSAGWDAGGTPDCVIIDQLGRPQLHPNYLRHDGKLVYEICPNVRKVRDMYLERAEALMKSGADGLFLDNAASMSKCWGPEFGKHRHIHAGDPKARAAGHLGFCYPKAARRYRLAIPVSDEEQTYASAMLIREIREMVRSFGADKRIMLNGGDGSCLPPIFYENCDSVMDEMFIYATYLDYNLPTPTHMDFQDHTPLDWLNVLAWQEQFAERGVRMNTFPSFSSHDPARRRHAVFAFCAAKLYDALPCTSADVAVDAWLRDIRLGRPLSSAPGSWGAVFFREYEGGLAAVNPFGVAQQVTAPWTGKPARIAAHGDARGYGYETIEADTKAGTVTFKLMPDQSALLIPAR